MGDNFWRERLTNPGTGSRFGVHAHVRLNHYLVCRHQLHWFGGMIQFFGSGGIFLTNVWRPEEVFARSGVDSGRVSDDQTTFASLLFWRRSKKVISPPAGYRKKFSDRVIPFAGRLRVTG
jgi:hypothetical protein